MLTVELLAHHVRTDSHRQIENSYQSSCPCNMYHFSHMRNAMSTTLLLIVIVGAKM